MTTYPYQCLDEQCRSEHREEGPLILDEKNQKCPRCGNTRLEKLLVIHLLVVQPSPAVVIGTFPEGKPMSVACGVSLPRKPYLTRDKRAATCPDCLKRVQNIPSHTRLIELTTAPQQGE